MANTLKYTDGTGPAFVDGTTTFTWTVNLQSLAASRTLIAPDKAGTIAVTSDITGTNSGTNTGDVTLQTFGSTPAAAGASISGQAITMQPADGTHGGGVSILAQTFAGAKTFADNVLISTAGKGLSVKEGSNAKQGVATLSSGTVLVSNSSVTANSRIFLTAQTLGTVTAPSALTVSARVASTSFTILASQLTDTSVVAYEIFEPA